MCTITHCVKLHSVCEITHFRICVNYTLFCKTTHFVQYQCRFFPFRIHWKILHLTDFFYTTSGCDGCDKYEVWTWSCKTEGGGGGGSRAVYTMCKKTSDLVEDGFPYGSHTGLFLHVRLSNIWDMECTFCCWPGENGFGEMGRAR